MAEIPKDVDRGWFMFFVTLLNHLYWFTGATLGGIFGSLIHFNTEGLDFVYADLESKMLRCRLREEKDHYTDRELKRRMAQIDGGRARYRELNDGNKWGDKSGYHLCINTTGLEIKTLLGAVREFVACYFDGKKRE